MAVLPTEDREKITKGLMSYWSVLWELLDLSVQDLQAAVNATDQWIDDNQVSFNLALPQVARDNLTPIQKTLIFCVVAAYRVSQAFAVKLLGGLN